MKYIAKKYSDIVGLDIGTSSIKLVWIRKSSASIELLGSAVKALPKPDAEAPFKDKSLIAGLIKSAISDMQCPAKTTLVCVNGPDVYTRRVSVVSMPEDELRESIKWIIKDQ